MRQRGNRRVVQVQLEANYLKNWAILYGQEGWDQGEKRREE